MRWLLVLVLLSLLELPTIMAQKICTSWRFTSVEGESRNNSIYFKVRSASRIGWTGVGFGSHKNPLLNSQMVIYSKNSFFQITNQTKNSSEFFREVQLVEGFHWLINDLKGLQFKVETSKLKQMKYIFFVESESSPPINTEIETREFHVLERLSRGRFKISKTKMLIIVMGRN
jgi:hypothetical protein